MRPAIPDYKPTDKPSAKKLNTILAELRRLTKSSAAPPMELHWGSGGMTGRIMPWRILWARLTKRQEVSDGESHTVGEYEWIQQRERPTGDFQDDPNGMRGTFANNPAYEINNGNFTIKKGENDIVQLWWGHRNPAKPEWLFASPESKAGVVGGWWSRLSARAGEAHSHVEVVRPTSACVWDDVPSGIRGVLNAYEINCSSHNSQGPKYNLIVRMFGPFYDTETRKVFYVFDYSGTNELDSERYPFSP